MDKLRKCYFDWKSTCYFKELKINIISSIFFIFKKVVAWKSILYLKFISDWFIKIENITSPHLPHFNTSLRQKASLGQKKCHFANGVITIFLVSDTFSGAREKWALWRSDSIVAKWLLARVIVGKVIIGKRLFFINDKKTKIRFSKLKAVSNCNKLKISFILFTKETRSTAPEPLKYSFRLEISVFSQNNFDHRKNKFSS